MEVRVRLVYVMLNRVVGHMMDGLISIGRLWLDSIIVRIIVLQVRRLRYIICH
jgi:hypothetical protein